MNIRSNFLYEGIFFIQIILIITSVYTIYIIFIFNIENSLLG